MPNPEQEELQRRRRRPLLAQLLDRLDEDEEPVEAALVDKYVALLEPEPRGGQPSGISSST